MVDLLGADRWKHRGDEPIREVMPWFEDPLIFLANADQMRHESRSLDLFADDKRLSELFRVRRGTAASPVDLPWLDAELAILVAVNMNPATTWPSRWIIAAIRQIRGCSPAASGRIRSSAPGESSRQHSPPSWRRSASWPIRRPWRAEIRAECRSLRRAPGGTFILGSRGPAGRGWRWPGARLARGDDTGAQARVWPVVGRPRTVLAWSSLPR